MEEGELSESQFEDLYEPREPGRNAVTLNPKPDRRNATPPTRGASDVDTPGGDAEFYGNEEEEGEVVTGEEEKAVRTGKLSSCGVDSPIPKTLGRDRSGSYSPYLSPREIQDDSTPMNSTSEDPKGTQDIICTRKRAEPDSYLRF
jgi:hypothetical protein